MTMKQPTIDDIYMADAYLTTPGVRQGLLERAADGNDDEVITEDTDDGQVVYYRTPYGEMVPVGRPTQVAPVGPPGTRPGDVLVAEVGSRNLPEQAYTGRYPDTIKPFDPTVRQQLADFLQAGFEKFGMDRFRARKQAQTLMGGESSNLPLALGLADIVPFLGTALQTQEAARMGEQAVQSAQQGNLGTAAIQAGGAALGMIPGAAGTVKAARKVGGMAGEAIDQAMTQGTGPAARIIPQAVRPMNVVPPGPAAAPAAAVSDIGFYSAVEQAAMKTSRKAGPGQAFLNDILKGENVKADEVKWIGLDDFLKGKKNVTREEVQDFIRNNRVDVQEVQLADVKPAAVSTENITSYFDEALTPNGDEARNIFQFSFTEQGAREPTNFTAYELRGGTIELYDVRGNFIDEYRSLTDARQHVINESQFAATQAEGRTKFGQYTLPGGKNYREILLTLPDNLGAKPNKDGYTPLSAVADAQFRSSHWDQPNVLAHIRVNDRVDADGKKMLLVEEVQSDWHQAGRDKGYKSDVNPEENKALVKQWDALANERSRLEQIVAVGDDADPAVQSAVQRLGEISNELNAVNDRLVQVRTTFREGVPDAPMKDTWYQLALKRVLKYAADNGYERVGLTTGARQAERYDLSKQVDAVMLEANGVLSGRIKGTAGWQQLATGVTENNVASYIGKEPAKRLLAEKPGIDGERELRGEALNVGGEGMKKYYDEVYPQFLAKYGKKWDASVGETQIRYNPRDPNDMPGPDETDVIRAERVRYIDITPQMRESVSKGQPLFTAVPAGTAAAGATMQDKEQK